MPTVNDVELCVVVSSIGDLSLKMAQIADVVSGLVTRCSAIDSLSITVTEIANSIGVLSDVCVSAVSSRASSNSEY